MWKYDASSLYVVSISGVRGFWEDGEMVVVRCSLVEWLEEVQG